MQSTKEEDPPTPSNVESQKPSNSDAPPAPPPDGGLQAWTQVLCMHFVFFNTWGINNSFSVFEQLYTATLPQSTSEIAWIGSAQVCFLFFVGVFAGRATDGGYFRPVYTLGVVLQLLGMFTLSLAKTYWQIFLSQAVCIGLGHGLIFSPGLAVMSSYFMKKRAFAVGLAAAGAATGGMIYPVVINQLLNHNHIGFGWTIRTAGFVMLVSHIPGLLFFRPRLPPRRTGPLIEWEAFTELPFVFFTISMFLNFWGLYFAFFYLGTFARDRIGIHDTQPLILILNAVGIIGRTIPNLIGDRITGTLNILIFFSFTAAILLYAWIPVTTKVGLYVFTVMYGLIGGAAQGLFPAAATTMTPDIKRTGTRIGMILSIVGIATLTGPAIQGTLIQRDSGAYVYAQVYAATSVLIGAVAAVAARVAKTGWVLRVKA